jgi:hypothetical protein
VPVQDKPDGGGALEATFTVADWVAVAPLALLQVSVYVVVLASWLVLVAPLVVWLPDHPPEAAQAVALAEDQVNMALPLLATLFGLALRVTLGAAVTASPPIDTMAEAVPKFAPEGPAMAIARVFVPVNGLALLIGMTNVLAVASPEFQVSWPRSDV